MEAPYFVHWKSQVLVLLEELFMNSSALLEFDIARCFNGDLTPSYSSCFDISFTGVFLFACTRRNMACHPQSLALMASRYLSAE